MEKEILEKFLSINEQNCNPTIGKYSSKKETFFEDIENEDYQKAYDVLNEDFRNTYFPNIEEFTTYVQKYFSSSNLGITYDNIERLGNNKTGNMYVVWIYIRNLLDLYKTDEQRETEETNYINFVILEHDYNNYEMSFSVVNIEE